MTFGWPFLVPSDSDRTDYDLLREAVELAHADEIGEWRAAVQRWQRDAFIAGKSDVEARTEMEELMRQHAAVARKRKIRMQSRWAFAVSAAAAGAAVAFPPLGIPAALFGLGALVPLGKIPRDLEAAASGSARGLSAASFRPLGRQGHWCPRGACGPSST